MYFLRKYQQVILSKPRFADILLLYFISGRNRNHPVVTLTADEYLNMESIQINS